MRNALITLALVVFAGLVALRLVADESFTPDIPGATDGPGFSVVVVKPLSSRPIFGLLPGGIIGLPPSVLRFDQTSPGAEIVDVGDDRLELRADGWELVLVTDGAGQVAPGTHLVFSLELANRVRTLRCRPADEASGAFETGTREDSDALNGEFLFELVSSEDAETGKALEWPSRPLTVRGRFAGLPPGRR